ncbi:uncharacterized protein KY384_007531 [Bacidia gigantensis]|uniref:uncharacterized protein n=1 Tax=Bacidia gigantensis TaxID=2732470 RepID=UPI001D05B7E5|nr:uncharacterized protein KY384_007531 [Bacidia gigantensis]KAG8527379.1 hypothetical protein KY384_007531 [Bacidia gigantensis]
MHRYKTRARREAWYCDDEDDTAAFNPFGKHHKPRKPITNGDEENARRMHTNASENFMTPTIEMDRQSNNRKGIEKPQHANTMPSSSPTSTKMSEPSFAPIVKTPDELEERPETSQDSGTGTNESALEKSITSTDGPVEGRPRRRKRAKLLCFVKDEDDKLSKRTSASFFKPDAQKFTFKSQIRATLFNSYINILLIFVPVGIAVNYAGVDKVAVFVINFIAIIPLAGMLSYATEEIALRVGETLGGLLNATFGNAVELIVSILALVDNQVDIVKESLIGSMLSNLLLVMGMSFFLGGINRINQYFNVTVAQTASSLLALAIGSLLIPAAFQSFADGSQELKNERIAELSRGTAILLLVVYACYLLFQLKTHTTIYNAPSQKVEKRSKKVEGGDASKGIAQIGAGMANSTGGKISQEKHAQEPEGEQEEPELSKLTALLTLAISTALVALCAEYMVKSINAITDGGSVSRTFVGLILLPIVGNAAEHATAVTVAIKDKMDLAIGVAVGSSMQIALLVIPFAVVLGWIMGKSDMNLAFDGFQIVVLFVSILLVNYLIQDGESHWLEGVLLMILYMIIAIAAWFYPEGEPGSGTHQERANKVNR